MDLKLERDGCKGVDLHATFNRNGRAEVRFQSFSGFDFLTVEAPGEPVVNIYFDSGALQAAVAKKEKA